MKNILISGASGGIGSEIARTFAAQGYRLFLIYNKNFDAIDKLSNELSQICEVVIFKCDLKNEQEVKTMVDKIISTYKRIDVLINSAGVS